MTDNLQTVKEMYDSDSLREWERLERHPFEFPLTTYMMEKYIRPGDTVLDIGGGPGRYSIHFAKMGCKVTLVDLSDGNIALAKEKAKEYGVEFDTHVCNCLELEKLDLGMFDHVLLMGPLYHLAEKSDKQLAVRKALEHLKVGGEIFCSFILDFAGLIYDMQHGMLVEDMKLPSLVKLVGEMVTGKEHGADSFAAGALPMSFINQNHIEPLMEPFGLEKLEFFGQEGILAPCENLIAGYPEEERNVWIELAKRFLGKPEYLSWSEHAMYVGRKA